VSRWSVDFTRAAAKEVRGLEPVTRRRVLAAVAVLETDPQPPGSRTLVGHDSAWRLRVGDFRILYEVDEAVVLVTVFRVAHRRAVYR
jgi:mRNA interferase RelE/StbE